MSALPGASLSAPKPKVGPHFRLPWSAADPTTILVHSRYEELKGVFRKSGREAQPSVELYNRAKRQNDHVAAADLVSRHINDDIIDKIVDELIRSNKPARIVFPHPEFEADAKSQNPISVTNALPFAFAAYMAVELGCEIETEIIEVARPGRTTLNRFERFLWQPSFEGPVRTDCVYILLDDTCTVGGTFAALRCHIVGNGGTVIAVSALSCTGGVSKPFGIANDTLNVLVSMYSPHVSSLWIEEVGHDISCLTEIEGAFLIEWASKPERGSQASLLHQLRERLAEAAASGRHGEGAK